jgi:hypothetical protein
MTSFEEGRYKARIVDQGFTESTKQHIRGLAL